MKKSLIATAALSLALVAGAAQAQVVGYVGAQYGHTEFEGTDANADAVQAEGAAAFNLGQFGALVDGALTYVDVAGGDDTSYSLTGHLNGKLGGALVGGFAGVNGDDDDTLWGVGLEAQAQLGANNTFYAQGGYGSVDDLFGSNEDADIWAARVELRHFYNENLKIQGSAGYAHIDVASQTTDVWNLGVEGEYQFAGTPWSVVAGYDLSDVDDLDMTGHTFRIGARYTFGAPSLKARNDAGADLGSVRKLFGLGGL